MSTYYTIEAEIIYRTPEALEKAVKPLRQGGWLKDDNTLVSEDSMLADPGNPVVIDGCVLRLPQALYRNLGRVIDEVFFVGAIGGYYKEFCEDGCFRINSYIFNDEGQTPHV